MILKGSVTDWNKCGCDEMFVTAGGHGELEDTIPKLCRLCAPSTSADDNTIQTTSNMSSLDIYSIYSIYEMRDEKPIDISYYLLLVASIHGWFRTCFKLNRSLGSIQTILCSKSMASADKPKSHSVSICTRYPALIYLKL